MSARRSLADRPPRRLLSTRPRLNADDDPVPGPSLPRAPVPPRLPAIPPAAPGAEPARCPDLLNVVPARTVEHGKLVRALTFSFVAGNDSGAVAHAFDAAPIAASTFEPECFFDELYVEELLRGCMSPPRPQKAGPLHERYLMRLLSQPPADAAVRALRTEVWRELSEAPNVRAAVDALFACLSELFSLFSGDDQVNLRGEQTRRRIEILRMVSQVLAAMQAPALSEAASCLHRTAQYAAQVCATPAYQHLEELLRYENERAYADLTLQLGSDGRVRGLRVVGVREDTRNRYHVSLAQQWLGRLGLWFRGFRVDDGEIIDRWLDQVFDEIVEHLPPLVQLYGDLEWYLAGQAFRDACLARGLPVCLPEWTPAEAHAPCRVASLYNPLLFALGVVPVSCDVEISPWGETTLITGPNSGGKTRLLQAVGLLQLCAQAGMWVPAAAARLRPVPGLFASLSQPAGAEQSEGRLGTELKRIRMLFERADPGTLVLVDELCSGTSPSEGEELFRLVLELMRELSPVALISTHFLRFAADLAAAPEPALPLHFIRVELDDRMRPTYRFGAGVADTSLAQQTAARLGVTREELRAVLAAKRP